MKEPHDRSRRCFLKASSMLGLAVAFGRAMIGEAFADLQSNTAQNENAMTQTSATQSADKTAIRPFQVNVPEAELTELRRRIHSTRWADREGSGANAAAFGDDGRMPRLVPVEELFKGRHFDREIVVLCVRWYLSFKLSYRDLVAIMSERT